MNAKMSKPAEPTDYICQNCGEIVWLDDGDYGREYQCECHTFPVYALKFADLPKFWSNQESKDNHSNE
ncbi:MAG: hypothetical protein WC710_14195 [Gallionella sp.]|jgi:hypothetical protein